MNLGLIVRADNRGLGIQTWEIWRHLNPAVTVCVDISPIDPNGNWPQQFERFPDAIISPWSGYLNPLSAEAVDALLTCDILFSVETTYDPKLYELARQRGIATVIYVNPELWRPHETDYASAVWVPSRWKIDRIPRAEWVPMPVALDRFNGVGGMSYLHVGGHKARGDRNGMETAIRAARYAGITLNVTTQDRLRIAGRGVTQQPSVENYWDLYSDYGVLVMPRKYGGLSLPVQEAMAAGLAVIMSDCPPNGDWPVSRIAGRFVQRVQMPGGQVELFDTDRIALATEMQRMADLDYRAEWQDKGRAWALAHSWHQLKAEWLARLAELC